jgi:serine/threonine protein kinase
LLENGSLFLFLRSHLQELSSSDRTQIALEVAKGIEYIHERSVIHRDLKSLNILLDREKRGRICDFGLVRLKSFAPMTGLIGTPQWMAPEILMSSAFYDSKVDVYSYGIVLWELLTGKVPYEERRLERLGYLVVQEQLRPVIPADTPEDLAALIRSCWAHDPKERPTFSQIITLMNASSYHFPGTDTDELWTTLGGRRHKAASSSDPLKMNSSPLLGHLKVASVLTKLNEAVGNSNNLAIDRLVGDLRSLYKSNILPSAPEEAVQELVNVMRAENGDCVRPVLCAMNDFLANSQFFEEVLQSRRDEACLGVDA